MKISMRSRLSNPRLWARFGNWLVGFLIHLSFSISALVVAIKDWNKDCENDNNLQISGSGWLITCEAVSLLYAILLLPGFLWWESHRTPKKNRGRITALKIYFVLVIAIFSLFTVIWDAIGVFLLFEEIEDCRGSSLWIMSVITLVRSWLHFAYPTSIVIFREIEGCWDARRSEVEPNASTETED